ncbi:MAG: hypothetical protein AMXMBFR84_44700 [Candidatus Hydrogenedentota bacterium]
MKAFSFGKAMYFCVAGAVAICTAPAFSQVPVWPTASQVTPGDLVSFYVMGDVPYHIKTPEELPEGDRAYFDFLRAEEHHIARHLVGTNGDPHASFVVHVGDIKRGASWPCEEAFFLKTWSLLRGSKKPVFIIPGDNEWNDCDDPDAAWKLWHEYFAAYDELWGTELPVMRRGAASPEDFGFHFIQNGVLFVGINLVGFSAENSAKYRYLVENAVSLIREAVESRPERPKAMVVFGHATIAKGVTKQPRDNESYAYFVSELTHLTTSSEIPTLYINGDAHVWNPQAPAFSDSPNFARVTIDEGGTAPPVRVTITQDRDKVFVLDRGDHRGTTVVGYRGNSLGLVEP